MKTILCHIYNEEYLLPWWLKHHRKYFDHGIIIDYASTDKSVDIVKELCPTWEIVQSRNDVFFGKFIDSEVYDIEVDRVRDWRICLNVTEFLHGDYRVLKADLPDKIEYFINCISVIDIKSCRKPDEVDVNSPLHEQFRYGTSFEDSFKENAARSLTNRRNTPYPLGRHYKKLSEDCPFIILKYKFAPMTDRFLERKLQIQRRIPIDEPTLFRKGDYHTDYGRGLTKEKLLKMHNEYNLIDISNIINKYTVHGDTTF